ncbi:uncharacterized protein A4U43_C01F4750 [Asparagus officinalis]|uniref:Uncharacterized protein n=2 Tax=Asparagus officinalis TaxID=4686 RepID=A0A5P1FM16_ASPOF|nr:uncharacterized protein A4U43_C01F4750 [Asparagus officinalis]
MLIRTVEEKSNGHPRSDKRSPPSPPEKSPAHNNGKNGRPATGLGWSGDASETSVAIEKAAAAAAVGAGSGNHGRSMRPFEWPRIYISLSRKEKEDDFLAMKGTKLPQRPKKRAKNIDKNLQYVFPGMWLSDLTRGRYEVREKRCVKKKRRGLKGMESMDSDSE